jgi:hypothetical protein
MIDSNTPTMPNMKIQLHEAALKYEISIFEQELQTSKDRPLEERVLMWANLVIYRSMLLGLNMRTRSVEEIESPRRIKARAARCRIVEPVKSNWFVRLRTMMVFAIFAIVVFLPVGGL